MNYGYLFFAGSGINSRREEMVIALCETNGCRQSGLGIYLILFYYYQNYLGINISLLQAQLLGKPQ